MYLTAHRVIAPDTGQTGINAFVYLHPGRTWHVPPSTIPNEEPGTLRDFEAQVVPAGNRVRSFVDIVAPDDVDTDDLRRRLVSFLRRSQGHALPWEAIDGPCAFAVNMDADLANAGWTHEVAALANAALALLQSTRRTPPGAQFT